MCPDDGYLGRCSMKLASGSYGTSAPAPGAPRCSQGTVENVWNDRPPFHVQTTREMAPVQRTTTTRSHVRVLSCQSTVLRSGRAARPLPGRSSMADAALPATPRILYIED